MSEHTPGPWTISCALAPSDGGYDYAIAAQLGARKTCIAEAFEIVREGVHAPAEANARLIAAAPDLLAALMRAEEWLTGWASAEPYLTEIRAALAQATGRQFSECPEGR